MATRRVHFIQLNIDRDTGNVSSIEVGAELTVAVAGRDRTLSARWLKAATDFTSGEQNTLNNIKDAILTRLANDEPIT